MKKLWLVLLALLIASPVFAQVNIVREERAKVTAAPPIGTREAFEITKRVALRVGGQVLIKTGGNNVDGFAVDIVCLGGHIFDVLGDSEGAAIPTWDDKGVAPGPCAPVPGASEPPPPVNPPAPPASSAATADLQQQQLAVLVQMVAELKAQNVALAQGLADLKAQIATGIKIRF
jgi:hypothetical protein